MDIRQNFLSLKFYTGKEELIGLPTANWIKGEDAHGSITFRIEDDQSLSMALTFARRSCEIALNTAGEHTRHRVLSSNAKQCTELPISPSTDYQLRPKDSKDSEVIKLHTACSIILHAVSTTERRWSQYHQSWNDIDRIFIKHDYEQGGFHIFKMVPLLEERGISSIKSLGSILSNYAGPKKYVRNYAGSLDSLFYTKLKAGKLGRIGLLFYECTNIFLTEKVGNPGAFFWRMIWQLLISCNFLNREYNSSFSKYIKFKYAEFMGENNVSDGQFLDISNEDWHVFLDKVKPWRPLYGIGQNVFDFIIGDIVEARFVKDSYKFDSANQHFYRCP